MRFHSYPTMYRIVATLFFWYIAMPSCFCATVDARTAQCREALGMQTKTINDSMISASSSYDVKNLGPQNARIRTDENGGAWCPAKTINSKDDSTYEWLQIDLGQLMVISLVETQGRFGNGQGLEYSEKYLLDYQREENGEWFRFRNRRGHEIISGNSNTYIAELRELDPPIIGRKIRFIPYSESPRTVCMRVEVYGCPWRDGVISYSMPQGERRGMEVDLYDFSYDGHNDEGYLYGGIGQLFDGVEGLSNFRLDPKGLGMKGYEWIGWKNDSVTRKPIEITFNFDTVRNFSSMQIHCNNMYSKDVRVFKSATVYFSVGGRHYQPDPIKFVYVRDPLMEYARPVQINLHHHIAQTVKVVLVFEARWIMISEVTFDSVPAKGNFTVEVPPEDKVPSTPGNGGGAGGSHVPSGKPSHKPTKNNPNVPVTNAGGGEPENGDQAGDIKVKTTDDPSTFHKPSGMNDQLIGIIVGALAALLFLILIVVLVIVIRYRRRKQNNQRSCMKPVDNCGHVSVNFNDFRPAITNMTPFNGKLSNGHMYNSVPHSDGDSETDKCKNDIYHEPMDCIQTRKLPDVPKTSSDYSDCNRSSREYAVPDLSRSPLIVALPPEKENNLNIETPSNFYAASDIVDIPNIQGVSGNNVYAVPNAELLYREEASICEFPRENLKFYEKLGEGQFGEVHLCEALQINDLLGDDFLLNRTSNRSLLVAVKILRRNVDEKARIDFKKEVNIMSRLRDPNIVRVLGVCSKDEPLCMIVEYMKYGDLNQFLAEHVAESTLARQTNAKALSYGALIYMAGQIASGMKYLESLNMVHRDLATRNCLVGHLYTIKISDFGMSRSLYSSDYYKIEGRAVLPIRWMAWESILLGKFSSKSDVWAFAITLWEVLTYCKEQPFEYLSDEKVIENCGHFYRNDDKMVYLPQPPNCPREIYDLMRECWNRNEIERPAFKEIHMFLQRKNMGYNPKDDKVMQNKLPVC